MPRILVVDDEPESCRTLQLHFTERGFDVDTAESADEGLALLNRLGADAVVLDIRMPDRDGLSMLEELRSCHPEVPVIMITAFHDLDSTVAAMHGGAVDCIPKPIDLGELENAIDRAINMHIDAGSDALVLDSSDVTGTIIGRSHAMKEVFKTIGMASQSPVPALIFGEPGSGKEMVARAIHSAGADSDEPFITVNCAATVETVLDSEIFGHERGAISGADGARKGKVELAGHGTVFLDEVSALSPHMQGELLHLVEERKFTRVGGSETIESSARFIAATNVDLVERVADGRFREDLYYRLNVFSITVPPLRDRREDIPLLVEHLLKKTNREIHKGIRRVPSGVMEALIAFDWPGNVRQLENVLMKAVVMAPGDAITMAQLPAEIRDAGGERGASEDVGVAATESLPSLKELEREHVRKVLAGTGWHKGRACEILGISRPRLERRIVEYGFTREQFADDD